MLTSAALSTIGYSALTDYELGLLKLLPMPAHLALDTVSAMLFCGAPLVFRARIAACGARWWASACTSLPQSC
jgi:hypothetical protein